MCIGTSLVQSVASHSAPHNVSLKKIRKYNWSRALTEISHQKLFFNNPVPFNFFKYSHIRYTFLKLEKYVYLKNKMSLITFHLKYTGLLKDIGLSMRFFFFDSISGKRQLKPYNFNMWQLFRIS